ncbi:MAG: FISUMP domain-containing protein [bacterium]
MKKIYILICFVTLSSIGFSQNPCPDLPTVTYDGKVYNTVQIGNQCWLKENLDVGSMLDSLKNASDNGIIEEYCYRDDLMNCNIYGGLYQWDEAMQYVTDESAKGICPNGWHIPTYEEFQTLKAAVNNVGNELKANGQGIGDGIGTNTSGFSALLAGNRSTNVNIYSLIGVGTYFWISTDYNSNVAPILLLSGDYSGIQLGLNPKKFGFSVRCIKD